MMSAPTIRDRNIDHLVICVRDLEAASRVYQALGFTLTPRALHPFGTTNQLAQLERRHFLELLGVADADKIPPMRPGFFSFGAFNTHYLEQREGMSMLVLASDDARRDQAAFEKAGLQTYAPFDFARKATLPDGRQVEVAFSMAFVTHPDIADAAFFTCQQHAPEYFWRREYQSHPNTAIGVSEVIMTAPEPREFETFFAALSGANRCVVNASSLTVPLGAGRLTVLSPTGCAARFGDEVALESTESARFVAYRVAVQSLDAVLAALDNGPLELVRITESDGVSVLRTAPTATFGVTIEFVEDLSETLPGTSRW